jgi:hypothetical protein
MHRFFEQLSSRIIAPFMGESSRNSKVWPCRCGQSLFFRNSQCLACNALLGYQPEESRVTSLQPGAGRTAPGRSTPIPTQGLYPPLRQPRHSRRVQLAAAGQR